ncbi:MAG: hypothetical protein V3T19_00465 [Acidiferrobacterales bacterium]
MRKGRIVVGAKVLIAASIVLCVSPSEISFGQARGGLFTVLAKYVVDKASESRRIRLEPEGARFLVSECERRSQTWAEVGFSKAEAIWNCSKLVGATLDRGAKGSGHYTPATLKSALPPMVETIGLKIVTQPLGAQVWMGGALIGETPIRNVNIKAHSAYHFVFRKSGFGERTAGFIANEFEPTQFLFVNLE